MLMELKHPNVLEFVGWNSVEMAPCHPADAQRIAVHVYAHIYTNAYASLCTHIFTHEWHARVLNLYSACTCRHMDCVVVCRHMRTPESSALIMTKTDANNEVGGGSWQWLE